MFTLVPDDLGMEPTAPTTAPAPAQGSSHAASAVGGVLIVDDHAGFRSTARTLLESEGLEIVGEASSGEDAIWAAAALQPDLVLLDIHLPGLDGFAVAELLAAEGTGPAVVLTSSRRMRQFGARIASSTARGFIAKDDLCAAAIDAVLRRGGAG